MTAWTDFVREYAAKNNVSYKTAMSQASESYKNRNTTQVKRNVAQRGLADIAREAKRDVETKAKEAKKVAEEKEKELRKSEQKKFDEIQEDYDQFYKIRLILDRLPKETIPPQGEERFDNEYMSITYDNGVKKFKQSKAMINRVKEFRDAVKMMGSFPRIKEPKYFSGKSTSDAMMLRNFPPLDNTPVDRYNVYTWKPDAKEWFKTRTKTALDAIEFLKENPEREETRDDGRVVKLYVDQVKQYYWALAKPDKFGFRPLWDFYRREDGGYTPLGVLQSNGTFWRFVYGEYPSKKLEAFYDSIEDYIRRQRPRIPKRAEILDRFF
jgi:hypothetical protein